MWNAGAHAVVNALDVDTHYAVEVGFAGAFYRTDVCDACVVHQNVDTLGPKDLVERGLHVLGIGDIAAHSDSTGHSGADFLDDLLRFSNVDIDDAHLRSSVSKAVRDGATNSAAASGDHRNFVFEVKRG
jgi:hypothetical protein